MCMSLLSAFWMQCVYWVYKIISSFQLMPWFLPVSGVGDEGKREEPQHHRITGYSHTTGMCPQVSWGCWGVENIGLGEEHRARGNKCQLCPGRVRIKFCHQGLSIARKCWRHSGHKLGSYRSEELRWRRMATWFAESLQNKNLRPLTHNY